MQRVVEPELLDTLEADDLRAIRSRRDLERLNAWMGHAQASATSLGPVFARLCKPRIADLGGGDGKFLLKLAKRLKRHKRPVSAYLVDRQPAIEVQTRKEFSTMRWELRSISCDVFRWLREPEPLRFDAMLANLFAHHFTNTELQELFCLILQRTDVFVAVEPRRSRLALSFSRMLVMAGCNCITQHDAPISVRAGFREDELSKLWPRKGAWQLEERETGLFSHLFIARRKEDGE